MGYPPAPSGNDRFVLYTTDDAITIEVGPDMGLPFDAAIIGQAATVQGAPSGDTCDVRWIVDGNNLATLAIADGQAYGVAAYASPIDYTAGDTIAFEVIDEGGATGPLIAVLVVRPGAVVL
jgi:hypothetical protein